MHAVIFSNACLVSLLVARPYSSLDLRLGFQARCVARCVSTTQRITRLQRGHLFSGHNLQTASYLWLSLGLFGCFVSLTSKERWCILLTLFSDADWRQIHPRCSPIGLMPYHFLLILIHRKYPDWSGLSEVRRVAVMVDGSSLGWI